MLKRGLIILLIVSLVFPLLSTVTAHANENRVAYYLQFFVDDTNNIYRYRNNVMRDDTSGVANAQNKINMEAEIGNFYREIGDNPRVSLPSSKRDYNLRNANNSDTLLFTFPSTAEGSSLLRARDWRIASSQDAQRARDIATTLENNLNNAMKILNSDLPFTNIEYFFFYSQNLADGKTTGGWTITYQGDYAILDNGEQRHEFIYKMDKGDGIEISWHQLMWQAWHFAYAKQSTFADVAEYQVVGSGESFIVEIVSSVLNYFNSSLGLYSDRELIWNEGVRTNDFYYGAFPRDWYDNTIGLYAVSMILAMCLLMFSMVHTFAKMGLSTANPHMRISIQEKLMDYIYCGILVSMSYPIFHFLLVLNYYIVSLIQSFNVYNVSMAEASQMTGLLGGLVVAFIFFFILLYLNYVYIMRAIMLLLLFLLSPIFIVMIVLDKKEVFNNFLKEVFGNIFIQSIHAFAFLGITYTLASSRQIEAIVSCIALVVVTETLRRLLINDTGMSGRFGANMAGTTAGLIGAGVGAGATMIGSSRKGNSSNSGGSSNNSDGGNNNSEATNSTGNNEMTGTMHKNASKLNARSIASAGASGIANTAIAGTKAIAGAGIALGEVAVGGNGATGQRIMSSAKGNVSSAVDSAGEIYGAGEDYVSNKRTNKLAQQIEQKGNKVERYDTESLSQRGIDNISQNGENMTLKLSRKKLDTADKQNLDSYVDAYRGGDTKTINSMKEKGIDNVRSIGNDRYAVTYNKAGIDRLGVSDVRQNNSQLLIAKNKQGENTQFAPTYKLDKK